MRSIAWVVTANHFSRGTKLCKWSGDSYCGKPKKIGYAARSVSAEGRAGMSSCLVVWRVGLVLAVLLMLATHSAAEPPTLSAAEAEKACADYLAAYVSNTEDGYKDRLPEWKFKCEHHPNKLKCEDTLDTIRTIRRISPLKCGQPVIVVNPPAQPSNRDGARRVPELAPVEPKIAEADNACANYMAAYVSNTEADYKDLLPGWKFKCEHHPIKLRCDDTNDTLQTIRRMSPLNCVGGLSNR